MGGGGERDQRRWLSPKSARIALQRGEHRQGRGLSGRLAVDEVSENKNLGRRAPHSNDRTLCTGVEGLRCDTTPVAWRQTLFKARRAHQQTGTRRCRHSCGRCNRRCAVHSTRPRQKNKSSRKSKHTTPTPIHKRDEKTCTLSFWRSSGVMSFSSSMSYMLRQPPERPPPPLCPPRPRGGLRLRLRLEMGGGDSKRQQQ